MVDGPQFGSPRTGMSPATLLASRVCAKSLIIAYHVCKETTLLSMVTTLPWVNICGLEGRGIIMRSPKDGLDGKAML